MFNQFNPYAQMMPQVGTQSLVRVNGIDGAKAYQLGANSTIALFDSNADIFYVKTTDMSGFPSIRVFKFEEVNPNAQANMDLSSFVSREEMQEYVKHTIQEQQSTNSNKPTNAIHKQFIKE